MEGRRPSRKETNIFMIFLVPLIAIMLIQSLITIGTLVMKRVTGMMEESSVSDEPAGGEQKGDPAERHEPEMGVHP